MTEMMLSLALSLSHYSIRSIEGVYMSIFMRVNCCCYTLRAKSCGGPMISCMNLSVQDNIHGVLMFPIPLFNISVVSDIPVIALVTVYIPRRALPLRIPVAAVRDPRKRVLDVAVQRGVLAEVELVPVRV